MKRVLTIAALALMLLLWIDACALALEPMTAPQDKGMELWIEGYDRAVQVGSLIKFNDVTEPYSNKTGRWSSSNPKVASVDSKGLVRAKKIGEAKITVTRAGKKASRWVVVLEEQESPAEWFDNVVTSSIGARLTGYHGPEDASTVVIPKKLGGRTVTEIGDDAFERQSDIYKVMMPDTIRRIGEDAFSECGYLREILLSSELNSIGEFAFWFTNLKSITIPANVTRIEAGTFGGCLRLKSLNIKGQISFIGESAFSNCNFGDITIGPRVQTIEDAAFYNNRNLSKYIVDPANPYYSGRSGVLYDKNQTRLVSYPQKKSGSSYKISKTVKVIGSGAFVRASKLKSISMGDDVAEICDSAFNGCWNLANVKLSKGLKKIGAGAFMACEKLKKIEIPEGVTEIGDGAFFGANKKIKVYLPRSVVKIAPRNDDADSYVFESGATLYVYQDSYAMRYAINNGYAYVIR